MGKLLMYGTSASSGWDTCNVFNDKNIDKEIKGDSKDTKNIKKLPKVSVPSPFARFELVQKAFSNVAAKIEEGEDADKRDTILVSHSLDVLQLFFEDHGDIDIVEWRKNDAINELSNSNNKGHKLLGKSLKLYMRQENYGFDESLYFSSNGRKWDDLTIYMLTYRGDVLGCTSPTSLFMATPRFTDFQESITIESDKRIFTHNRSLAERDEKFIEYIYKFYQIIKSMPYGGNTPLYGFFDYLESQKKQIKKRNSSLYVIINNIDPTYSLDNFELEYKENSKGVSVLGYTLFQQKTEDVLEQIANESDFVIFSNKSTNKPLVLSNNCTYSNWAYTSKNIIWDKEKHKIDYTGKSSIANKILPGTQTEYDGGWLCEDHFLSKVLVKLPYSLDAEHFFDGNVILDKNVEGERSYLLPINPVFFEYFDANYLRGKNGNNFIFSIEEKGKGKDIDKVVVKLLIPVKGGKPITLKKTYYPCDSLVEGLSKFDGDNVESKGYVVEAPIALSIFPFVKLPSNNHYSCQLLKNGFLFKDFDISLEAFNHEDKAIQFDSKPVKRTKDSTYYSLKESIEYLKICIENNPPNKEYKHSHCCILLPIWPESSMGTSSFRFSFDFGTTNSHISVMNMGTKEIQPFTLSSSIVSTIAKSNVGSDADAVLLQTRIRQEFLTNEIRENAFPLRTVISKPKKGIASDIVTLQAMQHVNIPFIYGKEDHGSDNDIIPNIKWSNKSKEQNEANAFIEELVMLARAYALENYADLSRCSIVWTYPLSMRSSQVKRLNDQWINCYKEYFDNNYDEETDNASKVHKLTESIAPYMFYRDKGINDGLLDQMTLSIDIGGGTCDVVITPNKNDYKIASFRFAADVIFGAADAKSNKMINTHYKKIADYIRKQDGGGDFVDSVLDIVYHKPNVETTEVNSVLFSLENNPLLKGGKSYNTLLSEDSHRKIIFLYFYSSIIYYLTNMLKAYNYPLPRQILFSGTGSKLLNIIGNKEMLETLTTDLIENFSEEFYRYENNDYLDIKIERREPKQLTAKGALKMDSENVKGVVDAFKNTKKLKDLTLNFTSISRNILKYSDLNKPGIKQSIVEDVERFNKMFVELINKLDFIEEYDCEEESVKEFEKYIHLDLEAFLNEGIRPPGEDDDVEDVLFFYPIKGVINKLIQVI